MKHTKKIKNVSLLVASMSLAFTGTLAHAQDTSDADEFLLTDTDGNGCVSWEELRNRSLIVFDALDVNNDGLIFGDEHLEAVDSKGETVRPTVGVDMASFQVELRNSFDRADEDEDKCLDRKEWDDG